MTDETLRALARQLQRTRAPEDEAAWLAHLARHGGPDAARVELAAALDHAPAVAALGDAPDGWAALRRLLVAEPGVAAPADALEPRLTLVTRPGEHRFVTADGTPVTLGRDPSMSLQLLEVTASRRHARVRYVAGRGFVLDDIGRDAVWIVTDPAAEAEDALTISRGVSVPAWPPAPGRAP